MTTKYLLGWLIIPATLLMALAACGGAANTTVEVASPPAAMPPAEPSSTELPPTEPPPAATEPPSTATPAAEEAAQLPTNEELAARVDEFLSQQAAEDRFSGAILIARGDEVILSQGYGLADRTQEIANTPQTRFHIASMSKAFTAMAIMQLVEQGELNVDDPICDYLSNYLSNCPANWEPITIHQLLTHTSGLGDNYDVNLSDGGERPPTADIVRVIAEVPPLQAPGGDWYYSNPGYDLLGAIVEQVSGQPYAAFVQANIFDPLGMISSNFGTGQPGAAIGYINSRLPANLTQEWISEPAGGVVSTVEDIWRWVQAHYSDESVSAETLARIFTPYVSIEPAFDGGYGYGWAITPVHGRTSYAHSGALPGFNSQVMTFPGDNLTIIVLSNSAQTQALSLSEILAKWALGVE